jgi:hypothetical protein
MPPPSPFGPLRPLPDFSRVDPPDMQQMQREHNRMREQIATLQRQIQEIMRRLERELPRQGGRKTKMKKRNK